MNNYYMNILKIKVLYNIGFYKFPTSELKENHVWPNQISHKTDNYTGMLEDLWKNAKASWWATERNNVWNQEIILQNKKKNAIRIKI